MQKTTISKEGIKTVSFLIKNTKTSKICLSLASRIKVSPLQLEPGTYTLSCEVYFLEAILF